MYDEHIKRKSAFHQLLKFVAWGELAECCQSGGADLEQSCTYALVRAHPDDQGVHEWTCVKLADACRQPKITCDPRPSVQHFHDLANVMSMSYDGARVNASGTEASHFIAEPTQVPYAPPSAPVTRRPAYWKFEHGRAGKKDVLKAPQRGCLLAMVDALALSHAAGSMGAWAELKLFVFNALDDRAWLSREELVVNAGVPRYNDALDSALQDLLNNRSEFFWSRHNPHTARPWLLEDYRKLGRSLGMQYKGVLISGVTATVQSDVKLYPGSAPSEASLIVHEVDPNGIPDTWWCSTAVWIRSRANVIPQNVRQRVSSIFHGAFHFHCYFFYIRLMISPVFFFARSPSVRHFPNRVVTLIL